MYRLRLLVLVCLCLRLSHGFGAEPRVNRNAIADVASGKLKEARASWWGFDADDATACLQAAIDSKVPKLIVDNVGQPWVVTPLKLISNQEILFDDGVEITAKQDAFHAPTDSLLTGTQIENVTLRGTGATLRMRRDDYADGARYSRSEWRHTLKLLSCRNITVAGLTLTESGGDGIYIGVVRPSEPNRNLRIDHVKCHRNYRQGISIISAEDLTIENTILSETAGTAPQSGLDFEPNHPDDRLVNCVVRHCNATNNKGYGFLAALGSLNSKSNPISIRIEDCKSQGNRQEAIALMTGNAPGAAVTGKFALADCQLRDTGLELRDNPAQGCQVHIKNCTFLSRSQGKQTSVPIRFVATTTCVRDLAGATIEDAIVSESEVPPIQLRDQSGRGLHIVGLSGTMTVPQNGRERVVELTEATLSQWMPQLAMKRLPRISLDELPLKPFAPIPAGQRFEANSWRVRGTGAARVWARKGQRVSVAIKVDRIGKRSDAEVDAVLFSPSNERLTQKQISFDTESSIDFTATETGAYRIVTSCGVNNSVFRSSTHPLSFEAEAGGLHLISSTGVLYFAVPKGTKEFGVRLRGEGSGDGTGEGIKAVLMNPKGRIVAEQDKIVELHQLTVEGSQSVSGIWSLSLSKPTGLVLEDYYVELVGVPSLLAPTKTAALIPAADSND